jgi:hypothetical protein
LRFALRAEALLALLSALLLGGTCGNDPAGSGPAAIGVHLTLNGIPDAYNDLLVVPSTGFVIDAVFTQGPAPIDPSQFALLLEQWGTGQVFSPQPTLLGTVGAITRIHSALPDGTYTAHAVVRDEDGNTASTQYAFAVRGFATSPPIGSDQKIWLDFESDRDSEPGPDFTRDLLIFGLGSPSAPALSEEVRAEVIARVIERMELAYDDPTDPNATGGPDPVRVAFHASDPGGSSVTRICIGGAAPANPYMLGSILIDPGNSARSSVECGTSPPTGIFPRGLSYFAGETSFQNALDPVTPGIGIPVGETFYDALILSPGFDYGAVKPAIQARADEVDAAIQAFADAVGTLAAHETGHALGLVPPGFPGGGLYGGATGAEFSHNVDENGGPAPALDLMNPGSDFTFADLAGLDGSPLPSFRATNYAYLRDRLRIHPGVTALLPPPAVDAITPDTIASTSEKVSITGSGFNATPSVALRNPGQVYQLSGESFVDGTLVTGWIIRAQVPPGIYDLELTNPDGQVSILEDAVTIQ